MPKSSQVLDKPGASDNLRATLDIGVVSQILGISRDKLYDMVRKDQFPAIKCGQRYVVSKAVVDRILSGEIVLKQ